MTTKTLSAQSYTKIFIYIEHLSNRKDVMLYFFSSLFLIIGDMAHQDFKLCVTRFPLCLSADFFQLYNVSYI